MVRMKMNVDVVVILANLLLGCTIICCSFLFAFTFMSIWKIIGKAKTVVFHRNKNRIGDT